MKPVGIHFIEPNRPMSAQAACCAQRACLVGKACVQKLLLTEMEYN